VTVSVAVWLIPVALAVTVTVALPGGVPEFPDLLLLLLLLLPHEVKPAATIKTANVLNSCTRPSRCLGRIHPISVKPKQKKLEA